VAGSPTSLAVASGADATLVALGAGLFEVTSNAALESRPSDAVTGLGPLPDGAVLVGTAQGLYEWRDRLLRRSRLDASLPRGARLVARRGFEYWFADTAGLLCFDGLGIVRVELADVSALAASPASPLMVASTPRGPVLIVARADGYETQALTDEVEGLQSAVPMGDHDVLGLGPSGRLLLRTRVEGGVAWRRVALTMDANDPGAEGLTELLVDHETGAPLAASPTQLFRLVGKDVVTQALTEPLSTLRSGKSGMIWGLSRTGLVRMGRPSPVTFSQVSTIATVHCVRCHAPDRQGSFSLQTASEWRARIDGIISSVTPAAGGQRGRMPADTVSTLSEQERAVIRQWKEDGLQ
jgi:hypothetical protein